MIRDVIGCALLMIMFYGLMLLPAFVGPIPQNHLVWDGSNFEPAVGYD